MTRMWMVDPRLLCREHLFGEHSEIHQLVDTSPSGEWQRTISDGEVGFIRDGRINKIIGHHILR